MLFTLLGFLGRNTIQPRSVRFSRGWMGPGQMGIACTRSAESVSPPFGQRNCPEMDSCALGRAYRKWNNTQYLWLPQGLATHWPGDPASDRQTVASPKFFTRSGTIHHSFSVTRLVGKLHSFLISYRPGTRGFWDVFLGYSRLYLICLSLWMSIRLLFYWRIHKKNTKQGHCFDSSWGCCNLTVWYASGHTLVGSISFQC